MKWSLKTLLVVIAIITIAVAWKSNYRNRCLVASKAIQNAGGTVYYVWERPALVTEGRARMLQPEPEYPWKSPTCDFRVNFFRRTENRKPSFDWSNPFGNADITIEAAAIPESKVTENLVAKLVPLNLKYLIIVRDNEHTQTKYAQYYTKTKQNERLTKLEGMEKSYAKAKLLLTSKLPNVEIVDSTASLSE